MRIGIDIQTLETFEANRGIGRLCRQMIASLLQYAPEHTLVLFGRAPQPPSDLSLPPAAHAEYAQIQPAIAAEELRMGCASNFLWSTPAARDIELYHVTSPLMSDILIPATAPCPVVATLLDAIPAIMHERRQPLLPPDEWERYRQRVRVLRTWQGFAAISQATADDCARLFDLDEQRIGVTYVPVEQRPLAGWTAERVDEVLGRYALARGYVLSVAGFHPRKNFDALFAAYRRLPSRLRKAAPLVIVCALSPEEKAELLRLAHKHGCAQEVRLPGFVPDADFPAFLAGAGVMFFPSRYEGFGLPVAEAMAAGVPVVVANRSSLPEVAGAAMPAFDPDDHRGFAHALEEILDSPDRAAALRAAGFMQVAQFAPERYVSRLLACYEAVLSIGAARYPLPAVEVGDPTAPLRVAVFTPLSPKMSGIADFAEELLLNFSPRIRAECFIDDYAPAHPAIRERVPVFPHWQFEKRHAGAPFDAVLYELGNNTLHAYMLPWLERHSGVIDLHDFSILGLFQHLTHHHGWGPETQCWLRRELELAGHDSASPSDLQSRDPLALPMTRYIMTRSKAVVVHSDWIRRQLADLLPDACTVTHIPLGVDLGMVRLPRPPRDVLRRKYHLTSHAFVVACIGVANRLKRLPEVLTAFREFNLVVPESYLVFIGPAERGVLRQITQMAAAFRIRNRIRLLGHRPLPELYEVLDLCDAVVNLRYPTMGESSATLAAAMAMGRPALVTPHGPYADYPDDACLKVPVGRHEKRTLFELFCELAQKPGLREEIGRNARRYVENWAFHVIASRYEELLFAVAGRPPVG
jgi:glycosyltransferase involved in cell wall biosynthesis